MSNLNLSYYYGNEAEQYSFYRIPKALTTDPRYKGLSLEAKFLYGLLLDRMSLSVQSGWLDGAGRVYIYYKLEEVMEQIGCGKDKALRLLRELDEIGLIERQRQGLGRPTRIYVKNFVLPVLPEQTPPERPSAPARAYSDTPSVQDGPSPRPAPEVLHIPPAPDSSRAQRGRENFPSGGQSCGAEREKTEVRTSENPTSALRKIGSQDFGFSEVNIMKNNTEKSNTEYPSIYPPAPTKAFASRSKERMREDHLRFRPSKRICAGG